MIRRSDLIEVGRRLWMRGLISGTDGNLSSRWGERRVLVTCAGVPKGFLRDEDFVEVSLDGKTSGRGGKKSSTETPMHLAIYRTRGDVGAVCHAHPPHATAFAAARRGITSCVFPEILVALGSVPLVPYATPSTEALGTAVGEAAKGANAFLLENHGAVTVGKDIWEAWARMEMIDHSARILIHAEALGGARELPSEEVDRLARLRAELGITGPAPRCGT